MATEKDYPRRILLEIEIFSYFVLFIYVEGHVHIFNRKTPKEMPPISLHTVNLYQSFSVSIYVSSGIQNLLSPKE